MEGSLSRGTMVPVEYVGNQDYHNNVSKMQEREMIGKAIDGYNPATSFYYIAAENPQHVFNRLLRRKHMFEALTTSRCGSGSLNNPDICKIDVIKAYITSVPGDK